MSIELGKGFDVRTKAGVQSRLVAKDFFEATDAVKVWWEAMNPEEQESLGEVRSLAWVQDGVNMYNPAIGPVAVTAIEWEDAPVDINLAAGTFQAIARVYPHDAAKQQVRYFSSNPAVAEITATGMITANADGVVTIYATSVDGGFSISKEITITNQ